LNTTYFTAFFLTTGTLPYRPSHSSKPTKPVSEAACPAMCGLGSWDSLLFMSWRRSGSHTRGRGRKMSGWQDRSTSTI